MNSKTKFGAKSPNKLALLGTSALVAFFGASSAFAQDTDTTTDDSDDDVIVVKGIRGAIQTAREIKRDADTFVDSITASDVSTLPDLSVAEALARVPGVVTQRFALGGSEADFPSPEGSGNIIRGLQYVRSEFNGRDAFSANGGRQLDWSSVPPELIGAVDVYKNASADLIQGGIAGTVNLRTLEPFDRQGMTAVVIAETIYTDLAEEWSPGFSVVLGNRWDTEVGEFGLLGSFSTSELQSGINLFQLGHLLPLPHPDPSNTSTIAVPSGFQARTNFVDRERDSYYLAGQFRSANDEILATVKYIRVENEIESNERTFEFFTDGESWAQQSILGDDYVINPDFTSEGLPICNGSNDGAAGGPGACERLIAVDGGLFESGVISNSLRDWTGARGAPFSSLAVNDVNTAATQDLSFNLKWRPADQWYVTLDWHYTDAEADRERLWVGSWTYSDFFLSADLDDPKVELILDPASDPSRRAGTAVPVSTTDPASSFVIFAADQFEDNSGDLSALRADLEYEFDNDGWFDAVKFGGRYSEREQINRAAGLNWAGIAPPWGGGGHLPYSESQIGTELVDFSDFLRGGVFQGDAAVIFPDRALLRDYDAFVNVVDSDPLITDPNGSFGPDWNPLRRNGVVDFNRGGIGQVREETQDFYVRLDFGNEFDNGMSIDGNIGVRYTKTTVTGEGSTDYSNIAPDIDESALDPSDPNYRPPEVEAADHPADFIPEAIAYFNQASTSGSVSRANEYWLPSVNVKWNLNDDMLIRFGASEAITRPDIGSLNANASQYGVITRVLDPNEPLGSPRVADIFLDEIVVNGGNAALEPVEAVNYDLSYEWYFGNDGSFTVSLFRKELENIILPYGEQNVGSVTLDGREVALNFRGTVNQNDGELQGIEVGYTQFFDNLPGLLANTGIQANYTYIDSETTPLPAFEDANNDGIADNFETTYRWSIPQLLGLSEQSMNLIGIYQDDKFEARLAYNWRSDYFSSYRDFVTGNPIIQEEVGFLDASLKYDITDNLQVRFQGANLLDTEARASQQIDQAGQRYDRQVILNDRRFEFGVRYQF